MQHDTSQCDAKRTSRPHNRTRKHTARCMSVDINMPTEHKNAAANEAIIEL